MFTKVLLNVSYQSLSEALIIIILLIKTWLHLNY